jgi:hypothetical protein
MGGLGVGAQEGGQPEAGEGHREQGIAAATGPARSNLTASSRSQRKSLGTRPSARDRPPVSP